MALCSTPVQCICRVIRRSSMTMKAHTYYIIFGRPPIGGKLPALPLAAPLVAMCITSTQWPTVHCRQTDGRRVRYTAPSVSRRSVHAGQRSHPTPRCLAPISPLSRIKLAIIIFCLFFVVCLCVFKLSFLNFALAVDCCINCLYLYVPVMLSTVPCLHRHCLCVF